MIKEQTVFVLGAGASNPYGYPTGQGLRKEICDRSVSDINRYFSSHVPPSKWPNDRKLWLSQQSNNAETFRNTFRDSSTKSIDLFLARNPDYMRIGKISIIFRILSAEGSSNFREDVLPQSEDWYTHLFDKMTDELSKPADYKRFSKNKLSFVTFNYDRSLEHFLYESLLNSFGEADHLKTKKQISSLSIVHVFGQVAGLDWQDLDSKIKYKTPKGRISGENLEHMIKNLRIIREPGENSELNKAQQLLSGAKRVFFLGFGYAKENLDALGIPGILRREQIIFGTALGLTNREINDVRSAFNNTGNLRLEKLDCRALLRELL